MTLKIKANNKQLSIVCCNIFYSLNMMINSYLYWGKSELHGNYNEISAQRHYKTATRNKDKEEGKALKRNYVTENNYRLVKCNDVFFLWISGRAFLIFKVNPFGVFFIINTQKSLKLDGNTWKNHLLWKYITGH